MKPAILIVHGAWHVPQHYDSFVKKLQGAGYEVHVPHLPSCGELAAQSTLEHDVRTVHRQLVELVESFRHVLLIAHSYGGAVATQALEGDNLLWSARQAQGQLGGVLHLIYMCGFMLQPGQSCLSASQPRPDPDPVVPGDDGTSFLGQPGRLLFYNDVDEDVAATYERLLVRHSLAALAAPISYAAWQHLPTTYLKCTEDQVLFRHWQEQQIQAVKDCGREIEVWTYKASHSPYLSMSTGMAAVVESVAEKYETG